MREAAYRIRAVGAVLVLVLVFGCSNSAKAPDDEFIIAAAKDYYGGADPLGSYEELDKVEVVEVCFEAALREGKVRKRGDAVFALVDLTIRVGDRDLVRRHLLHFRQYPGSERWERGGYSSPPLLNDERSPFVSHGSVSKADRRFRAR